jgi:histidinol-phosphate aminotransferase
MSKILRRGRRLAAMLMIRSRRVLDILAKPGNAERLITRPRDARSGPDLAGRVVVITGSTRGVGDVVAKAFAAQGAKIVVNGRTRAAVDRAAADIKSTGAIAVGAACDVGTPEGARHLIAEAVRAFGTIDILINNAGVAGPTSKKAWETLPQEWRETLRVNVEGPYLCASAAIEWMIRAGRSGRIINVSSGAGDMAVADISAYGVSKVALQGLTRFLAADLGRSGISVVALQLGSLRTDMTKSVFRWEQAELLPPPETVVPAFVHAATAPDQLVHGRTISAWRYLSDPGAEAIVASPLATSPMTAFPELKWNGVTVSRESTDAAVYDRGESKFGASPKVAEAIGASLQQRPLAIYPEDQHDRLRATLARQLGIPPECFVVGNGSSELIHRLLEFLVKPNENVVSNKPGWFGFNMMCRKLGVATHQVPFVLSGPANRSHHNLDEVAKAVDANTRLIYLINPSNPEGVGLQRDEFLGFLEAIPPELPVIVDEAYIEFAHEPNIVRANELVLKTDRTIIGLRTFSKFHGLAALRVGYGFAKPQFAALINRMGQIFNVSALSEIGATAALMDIEFQDCLRRRVREERNHIESALQEMQLDYVPSQAPFMLIECPCDIDKLYQRFASEGVFLSPKTFFANKFFMFPVSTRALGDHNLAILRSLI